MNAYKIMLGALSALALAGCELFEFTPTASDVSENGTLMAPWTKGAMVAAADPRAVEAGLRVLREGGHAVDAAIAVHAVLGLVEPQSSGLGGGAFMLVFERGSGDITVYDGRETAPLSADENLFIEGGEALGFVPAWQSGRSTGVPGAVKLYESAHQRHGKADWSGLFTEAIMLADEGFVVSPRLADLLSNERLRGAMRLDDAPTSAAYFYPGGEPLAAGDVRDNPDYASLLRRISKEGAHAFYLGEVAQAIAEAVSEEPLPGSLSVQDIASYQIAVRDPVCHLWRSYQICSAPPPSSGGVAQSMIVDLYGQLMGSYGITEGNALRAFVDAQRLTYADRDHYIADADYVAVPVDELLDPAYLSARAKQVFAPEDVPVPGDPGAVLGTGSMVDMWGTDQTIDVPGTTHISIVDGQGNAVSMTATVESPFGSSRMVHGFLLNNELTDFSLNPRKGGKLVANAPAGGKRPRSSMSPTIVLDDVSDLKMVTGSPGGNAIIAYVAKTIIGVLDWGKSADEAIAFPNIIARGQAVNVEVDVAGGPEAAETLRAMGYPVKERRGENSGLHVIVVRDHGLEGGADPRREGAAISLD